MRTSDYVFWFLAGIAASIAAVSFVPVKPWQLVLFGCAGAIVCMLFMERRKQLAFAGFFIGACLGFARVAYMPEMLSVQAPWMHGFMEKLNAVRSAFSAIVYRMYPEPVAGFVQGILLGSKGVVIDSGLWDALRKTSTAHMIAISGYNITIVASGIARLLHWATVPRKWIWIVASCAIAVFTMMVGAPASAIRAAVMAFLIVCAQRFSRRATTHIVFALTLAAMLFVSPSSLRYDFGFQLSFLAAFGIMYVAPLFDAHQHETRMRIGDSLRAGVRETLVAQATVFPLLLHRFGTVSLIGMGANFFALPLIPFAMGAGFLAAVAGVLSVPLGHIVALLTLPLFRCMLWVISFFAALPGAALEGMRVSPWFVAAYYICFAAWFFIRIKNRIGARHEQVPV